MQRKGPEKHEISCPSCGHKQMEYVEAKSTFCQNCGVRISLEESHRGPRERKRKVASRRVNCLHCQSDLRIPLSAMSWQCNHCSAYLDMTDHVIEREQSAKSGMIQTYGDVHIKPGGFFNGKKIEAANILVEGKCRANIKVYETLVIGGKAFVQGDIDGPSIQVKPKASLRISKNLRVDCCVVSGQLAAQKVTVQQALEVTETGSLTADLIQFGELSVKTGGILKGKGIALKHQDESADELEV
ncbi:MAG: polymer-forming cytoskeletal protein [Verrucomicrobiota bacterium]